MAEFVVVFVFRAGLDPTTRPGFIIAIISIIRASFLVM
jgi:hypothetical protein